MKAARLHKPHSELKVEEIERPPVRHNEVSVRIKSAGVCGTDLHIQDGEFLEVPGVVGFHMELPRVLGHEISGVVEEVGSSVTGLKKGDRVVVDPILTCGVCYYCIIGERTMCENRGAYGESRDGGFAQYGSFLASNVHRIPDSVGFDEAAIMADSLATPFHAMNLLDVKLGDKIAIFGVGGLGANAVQLAKLRGAVTFAVDILEEKLKVAKELGADFTFNAGNTDPVKAIKEHTDGRGVDKALEMVGGKATVEQAVACVRRGGKVGIVGGSNESFCVGIRQVLWNGLTIVGCYGSMVEHLPRMLELVATGRINLRRIITHRFPLDRVNEGFRVLRQKIGNPMRVVIVPE